MKIEWSNPNTMRWFEDASVYTGYHDKLTDILLEHMPVRGTLCDMGCGMGLIDYAMAPHFEAVTCIDCDEDAIASLNGGIARRGIKNINTICADSLSVNAQWDNIIALFHGDPDCFTGHYYNCTKHTLIAVTRSGNAPYPYNAEAFAEALEGKNIPYELLIRRIEYGQPLLSYKDAENFVHSYSKAEKGQEKDFLTARLEKTGRSDFPYYLPNNKEIFIFVVQK